MRVDAWFQRYPAALIAVHAACVWPVWRWYTARLSDGSDEPWGIIALIAAVALTGPRQGLKLEPSDQLLRWAAGFTLAYALVTPFAPPMICALFAITAFACTWVSVTGSRAKLPVVVALFALSLPVIASLQFYVGYPLRAITAAGATELLNPFGYDIQRAGTAMEWEGRTVLVDAPCSGVRMLWAGAFLACVLIARRSVVRWVPLGAALLLVIPTTVLANIVRAAALFLLELHPQPVSGLMHALVGLGTFLLLGLAIVFVQTVVVRQRRRGECVGS